LPCYIVKDKSAKDGEPKDRLVEANNKASARNHVSRDRFEVATAKPTDIQRIVLAGGQIEVATGAEEIEDQLPEPPAQEEPPKAELKDEKVEPKSADKK
jgi:hypothetical protein